MSQEERLHRAYFEGLETPFETSQRAEALAKEVFQEAKDGETVVFVTHSNLTFREFLGYTPVNVDSWLVNSPFGMVFYLEKLGIFQRAMLIYQKGNLPKKASDSWTFPGIWKGSVGGRPVMKEKNL